MNSSCMIFSFFFFCNSVVEEDRKTVVVWNKYLDEDLLKQAHDYHGPRFAVFMETLLQRMFDLHAPVPLDIKSPRHGIPCCTHFYSHKDELRWMFHFRAFLSFTCVRLSMAFFDE